MSTFACFPGKAFLGKPTSSRLVENTHGSKLDCRLCSNSFAPALGGACAMETNTVALIQNRNSGHHDSSTKAVFLCTADKLQCCHMLASCTQHTQPSPNFIQHSFKQWVHLSFQVLSFENSHWAGLGRILRHCTTAEKQPFPISVGRLSLANLQGACAMETNTVALIKHVKFRPS